MTRYVLARFPVSHGNMVEILTERPDILTSAEMEHFLKVLALFPRRDEPILTEQEWADTLTELSSSADAQEVTT